MGRRGGVVGGRTPAAGVRVEAVKPLGFRVGAEGGTHRVRPGQPARRPAGGGGLIGAKYLVGSGRRPRGEAPAFDRRRGGKLS